MAANVWRDWTRRDVLKTGLAASLGATLARRVPRLETAAAPERERLLLDFGWRFHLGHGADPAQDFGFGAGDVFAKAGTLFEPSRPDFDAGAWRAVDLPHDWAVELPFVQAEELKGHGYKPLGRNYPATSVGWYRRVFDIPATDRGRRLSLEFDGVYRDAIVALNGHFLDRNLSGYAPFRCDITDLANYGGPNVLVVRADATEREGWFYEGAGIYRHVWLVKTAPLHVPQWGTFVTAAVHAGAATVTIATEVANESDAARSCRVVSTIVDPAGRTAARAAAAAVRLEPWSRTTVTQHVAVSRPQLWSVATPALYRLETALEAGGVTVDRYATPFGIRSVRFDADRGFLLNGEPVKIKGTCNHQDHAGVGAALPDRLQSYRVERLKAMASNAYRTSHNPPTPELLDACDRLGMLVLDESRMFSESAEGTAELERMIRRDRNHPCVFAWSIANEEWVVQGGERGAAIAAALLRVVRRLDATRPVTAAMDSGWGNGISNVVDVQGCNYQNGPAKDIDALHHRMPAKPIIGTETASTLATRGIYANDATRGYMSAYDVNAPPWGATAEQWWSYYGTRAYLAGGFVWTGFDYRGEPTPYAWPCISSHFGVMDTCGFPKDDFFYYQAWWGDAPVVHLFPHWNWAGREGQEIEVWCHTNLERVELFLNGQSLGAQDVARNSHAVWKVPYAPGTLEARGMRGGAVLVVDQRATAGPPARVTLRADRDRINADGEDVVVVTAAVVDAAGRVVPDASDAITFDVAGGTLIGVGNGDPSSHESDRGPGRQAFNGWCCAIVQATKTAGEIRVTATAAGLEPATASITAAAAAARPAVP